MTAVAFQRARKPEEREFRRAAILAAAAALFDEAGPQGAGLNAIAARAGFTKSNVYRYFESREEVLLSLFLDEFARFLPRFEIAVAICPDGDTAAIASATAHCFLDFPRLAHLLAILSSVLEQNISEARVIALKRATNEQLLRTAFALHDKLPRAAMEDCAWVAAMVGALVAGMWPGAHPPATVERVLAMPEFVHLKLVPGRDLERATRALLDSIAGGEAMLRA